MSDFYITLPSSVPNPQFKNTSSRYITRLPEVLNLERDKYVVAATDIIYPYSYVNVGKPLDYWVHFKTNRLPLHITFPPAQYSEAAQIVNALNNDKTRLKRGANHLEENEASRIKRARSVIEEYESLGENTKTADIANEYESLGGQSNVNRLASEYNSLGGQNSAADVASEFESLGGQDKVSDWAAEFESLSDQTPVEKEKPKNEEPKVDPVKKVEPKVVKTEEPKVTPVNKEEPKVVSGKKEEHTVVPVNKEEPKIKKEVPKVVLLKTEDPKVVPVKKDEPKVDTPKKNEAKVTPAKKEKPIVVAEKKDRPIAVPEKKAEAKVLPSKKDESKEVSVKTKEPKVTLVKKDDPNVVPVMKEEPKVIAVTDGKPQIGAVTTNQVQKPIPTLVDAKTGETFVDEFEMLGNKTSTTTEKKKDKTATTEKKKDETATTEKKKEETATTEKKKEETVEQWDKEFNMLGKEPQTVVAPKEDIIAQYETLGLPTQSVQQIAEEYNILEDAKREKNELLSQYVTIGASVLNKSSDETTYQQALEHFRKVRSKLTTETRNSSAGLLHFKDVGDQIQIDFLDSNVSFVEFDDSCAYFLGFIDLIVRNSQVAQKKIDYFGNVSTIYLYCDVVDPIIVGDTKSSLLSVIPCRGRYGEMIHYTVAHPRYLPLMKATIDSIRVDLLTEFSEPIDFNWGSTIIVLHFKRIE